MHVFITGASGGLGTAVVRRFLKDGALVTGVARQGESSLNLVMLSADLSHAEGARRAVEAAENRAPIDVLVHVLGGFGGGDPVATMKDDDWHGQMNLNFHSAFYAFRAVLPGMLERKSGRLIAIGSKAAVTPIPNYAAYSVSKSALLALVKAVAGEVGGSGVTANAVLPGTIDTPANRKAMPDADFAQWVNPDNIASLIAWLASPAASDVNGAMIPIYGPQSD
jgi:NAD(P)-dependent dehydrogenase (short-subunit alcohol dehydrogenase family)